MKMRRVLVVDDNSLNRKVASAMLRKRGWAVDEAADGLSALAQLDGAPYDYVLLDISMPGIDGEEVCRRIRDIEVLRHLRVVAYTAHTQESEKARILSAGFDDIVIKPVSMAILQEKFPD
jgi:two-component system, chemotaxis family, chemotaxis protein CheY